jgi:hypothetical protein
MNRFSWIFLCVGLSLNIILIVWIHYRNRPNRKDPVTLLLIRIDEIRDLINKGFQSLGKLGDVTPFKRIVIRIFWKSLVTFHNFKLLWNGGFIDDAVILMRALLEADVRLLYMAEDPDNRALLYEKAGEYEQKLSLDLQADINKALYGDAESVDPRVKQLMKAQEDILNDAATLGDPDAQAVRHWRRLSFRQLCFNVGRSHDYLMYQMCSRTIHSASGSLSIPRGSRSVTDMLILKCGCEYFLSIAKTTASAFNIPRVREEIDHLMGWIRMWDHAVSSQEMIERIQKVYSVDQRSSSEQV